MIRFNKQGQCNIPYCRKDKRFSRVYISKIINQIYRVAERLAKLNVTFICQDFLKTIAQAGAGDLLYCDPPYIERHADYYNKWSEQDERSLYEALKDTRAKFILSTWHHNDFRANGYIEKYWGNFNVFTREHFYHVGASESNRHRMVEALITNFSAATENLKKRPGVPVQCELL